MRIVYKGIPVPDFEKWLIDSRPVSRHWQKVTTDCLGARSLTLIIEGYRPYLPTIEGVTLSAFYVASNDLHRDYAKRALNVPIKPIIASSGIGKYTLNGLTAVEPFGHCFAAAVIPSAEPPSDLYEHNEPASIREGCFSCGQCVQNCPAHAIDDGRIKMDACLRAQAQFNDLPFPDTSRGLIGTSVWGCNICMDICPLNRKMPFERMTERLERALELRRLLSGDVGILGEYIGTNYARKARMQARACMVASNLARSDLLPEIKKLLEHNEPFVRQAAAWSINKLLQGECL